MRRSGQSELRLIFHCRFIKINDKRLVICDELREKANEEEDSEYQQRVVTTPVALEIRDPSTIQRRHSLIVSTNDE